MKQEALMEALKYSPLGISVHAWKQRNGLYWKNPRESDNHWVCLYGYKKGQYWKVYDSYNNTEKQLEFDYDFLFAKRYYLSKKKEMTTKLVRKKGTKEVFIILNGERYWIKEQEDFRTLKASQPVKDVEWVNVEEVENFVVPYNGKIIGSPNFSDWLKIIFGKIK